MNPRSSLARVLRTTLVALLPIAVWPGPVTGQTAEELIESGHVRIRHRLEPAEPVYVGQPVRLWVEVMTRTWFLRAPQYPLTIEVSKAIVIPPDAFGVNSTERIDGETYAVQGRAFTIFPQVSGRFEVPPIPVTLVVARDDGSQSPEIPLETQPVVIEATFPAGVEGRGLVLSTPRLTVSETYSRSTEELEVGDSFKRRITTTIDNSVAMLLPPITFEASEGIAVYPARPEVEDKRNRGQLTGTRVDEATYLMEAEGSYELPEISIWWWNLRTSALEHEVLPSVELTVAPNPDLAPEHLGELREADAELAAPGEVEEDRAGWREWVIGVVALALVVWLVRRFSRRASRTPVQKSPEAVEEEFFRRFETTAREGDPAATYQAFLAWLDHYPGVDRPATAAQFVGLARDEGLSQQLQALEGILFGPNEGSDAPVWDASRFAALVGRARTRIGNREHRAASRRAELPALNP